MKCKHFFGNSRVFQDRIASSWCNRLETPKPCFGSSQIPESKYTKYRRVFRKNLQAQKTYKLKLNKEKAFFIEWVDESIPQEFLDEGELTKNLKYQISAQKTKKCNLFNFYLMLINNFFGNIARQVSHKNKIKLW